MFKNFRDGLNKYINLLKDTGEDYKYEEVVKMPHRTTVVEEFKPNLMVVNIQLNENPSYGANLANRGRKIGLVYPMYDNYKVFFEKFILFYNCSNSIICMISTSGEKIAEGVWGLSFTKNSISLYKADVQMEMTLNADGSRSSTTKDFNAVIKRVNKHLENTKISSVPHNPDWLVSEEKIYFDEIPDKYCVEFYFITTNPIILNSESVDLSTLESGVYKCIDLGNVADITEESGLNAEDLDEQEKKQSKSFETLDDIINNHIILGN